MMERELWGTKASVEDALDIAKERSAAGAKVVIRGAKTTIFSSGKEIEDIGNIGEIIAIELPHTVINFIPGNSFPGNLDPMVWTP